MQLNFESKSPIAMQKRGIRVIQINVGNLCNQACAHCHIEASPKGSKNMTPQTASKIIEALKQNDVGDIEFTGGTPEMNPSLPLFIDELSAAGKNLSVRTSLSVLLLPKYAHLIECYHRHRVKIIASFPALLPTEMDKQRGKGAFDNSVAVLQQLNRLGFGTQLRPLDLVYNATGESLPPPQDALEQEYKKVLQQRFGIDFNRLVTIVNAPIGRYKKHLVDENKFHAYMHLLQQQYNKATLDHVMCRHLISVDHMGYVYDCDFNQALGIPIKGYEQQRFWEIDWRSFSPDIPFLEHCYACTVNSGSSCTGELLKTNKTCATQCNTSCG